MPAEPGPPEHARRPLRVLCVSVYPQDGPSVRHRILAYAAAWRRERVELTHLPFLTRGLYARRRRFGPVATAYKLGSLAFCTLRLVARLPRAPRYDAVVIHREAFPLGGALFERCIARLNPRVVYDLDDAIWHRMPLAVDQRGRFYDPKRVARTMAASACVVAGNDYIRAYAARHCGRTTVIPTPYRDLGGVAARAPAGSVPAIVWIGNVGNEEYLGMLTRPLQRLAAEMPFVLRVIGGPGIDRLSMPGVTLERHRWSAQREDELLATSSIGVMPLEDRDYERGKCAFKLVQYFSAGLPVVASPVGMNASVVSDDQNGYLAASEDDWYAALKRLVEDASLRARLGTNGYALYRERFTIDGNAREWLRVLDEVAGDRARGR